MLWSQTPSFPVLSLPLIKSKWAGISIWFLIPTLCTWPNHSWVLDSYTSFALINSCFLGFAIACIWSQIPCYLVVDHPHLSLSLTHLLLLFLGNLYFHADYNSFLYYALESWSDNAFFFSFFSLFFFKLDNLFCKIIFFYFILSNSHEPSLISNNLSPILLLFQNYWSQVWHSPKTTLLTSMKEGSLYIHINFVWEKKVNFCIF